MARSPFLARGLLVIISDLQGITPNGRLSRAIVPLAVFVFPTCVPVVGVLLLE